ncbi:hypothetical protein P280DRAFT_301238 [Massarina eburnea CBS 473.64]|uniref:Uncharacterized protein n=1 Tax=Massarina eburnea CBS 473.64 TaxID=1395130 RepID=A0A6A6RZS2_9PLEO|nr:hypothetical protein P280DRAFT_301238 [Massarina eburnea CBS 473.64]
MLKAMCDNYSVFCEKLESLQVSVKDSSVYDKQSARLTECIDALQTLQQAPSLSVEDLRKTDESLRTMHEK